MPVSLSTLLFFSWNFLCAHSFLNLCDCCNLKWGDMELFFQRRKLGTVVPWYQNVFWVCYMYSFSKVIHCNIIFEAVLFWFFFWLSIVDLCIPVLMFWTTMGCMNRSLRWNDWLFSLSSSSRIRQHSLTVFQKMLPVTYPSYSVCSCLLTSQKNSLGTAVDLVINNFCLCLTFCTIGAFNSCTRQTSRVVRWQRFISLLLMYLTLGVSWVQ